MKIELEIKDCYSCPHSTNSSREHDCAFTPAPHPTIWYCKHPINVHFGDHLIIQDPYIIHPKCKLGDR